MCPLCLLMTTNFKCRLYENYLTLKKTSITLQGNAEPRGNQCGSVLFAKGYTGKRPVLEARNLGFNLGF